MAVVSTEPVPFLDEEEVLVRFLDGCPKGALCCVDTEADSLYSYREKICLIQFACGEHLALIDPLAIKEQTILLDFLDQASEVWMHGADYDMSILNRTYGRVPNPVYDTQIAARLLGWRTFGFAHLIKDITGVELSKQSQKKNWGERPLPEKMLEYAANDVRYLMPLIETFRKRLHELDRWDWFLQSCDGAREQVLSRPEKSRDQQWRIPGWGRVSPRALAYLREIWGWRDGIASRRDKPPFKVISNEQLLKMSVALAEGESVSLPPRFRPGQRKIFDEAVARARAVPNDELPRRERKKRPNKAEDWEEVFQSLRANRDKASESLDLEASVIASKASLERYAFSLPEERTAELRDSLFLPWQQEILFATA